MRLIANLVVAFLLGGLLFGAATAAELPRPIQDDFALYVCANAKLVKFDAATGAKLDDFGGVPLPADAIVALDESILVTDEDAANVRRFDPNTGLWDALPFGETNAHLTAPRGIARKPDGHFFVADVPLLDVSDVVEFDENGAYVQHHPDDPDNPVALTLEDLACNDSGVLFATQWEFAGDETVGVLRSTETGWELFGQTGNLSSPWGLAFGPDGDLYVVDDSAEHFGVWRYDGTTGASEGVFGQTGASGNLNQPHYCTFGPDGDLYVTDAEDSSVRKFRGPLSPSPGSYQGVFGESAGAVPVPLGLVFGPAGTPEQPATLSVASLGANVFRVTLANGVDGVTYDVLCTSDLTQPFASWQNCGTIQLVGTTTGTLDDTEVGRENFYVATQQAAP
ncbi:MAG: hypothetical protein Q8Q12_07320 [bacterium]|nr:hypothetical protein [bacterium]